MYQTTISQFVKMLGNLAAILDKADKFAVTKKFDSKVLLNSRLAPDMFSFTRQVQVACDTAKGAAARLAGQDPPKHEDNEDTLDQLRARIHKTVQYLNTLKPEAFTGAEKRMIAIPWKEGKALSAEEYLHEMALPNFYFHLSMAYAILRHNGVELGKMDYLGNLNFRSL